MKRLMLALLLTGCAQAPSPAAIPTPPPSPSVVPGVSTDSPWKWEAQGTANAELSAALADLDTPEKIATWLEANVEWRDDYDTTRFLAPNQVASERRTVCTGFARFWIHALARIGIKAEFLAFWAPTGAHAVAVARINGQYRLFSNQFYYGRLDLGHDRDQAHAAAAAEFYGQTWSALEWWLTTGQILTRVGVDRFETPQAPLGRNLFTIRR